MSDTLMQDLTTVLSNKRRTHTTFKDHPLETLKGLESKFSSYIAQRDAQESEKRAAKNEAKGIIKEMMAVTGLTREEVKQLIDEELSKSKASRKTCRVTATSTPTQHETKLFRYGDNETWDGTGSVPQALQALLDEGFELSDFEQNIAFKAALKEA